MPISAKSSLGLRPVQPLDEPFLLELYGSTRQTEMDLLPWSSIQKEAFLNQQFLAQSTFYRNQFPDASFQVITFKDQPIGRLYIDLRSDEIRIVDIALLPAFRNRGFGTHFLNRVLDEAKSVKKCVRIHVESQNPAMSLYKRFGFRKVSENGIYFLMEANP